MEMKLLCVLFLATLLKHAGAACYSGTDPPQCKDCGGDCTSDNGCVCSDYSTTCVPTNCIMNSNDCCPLGYFWDSSASCCTDEFMCSPACAGDEKCVDINGSPDCVCNDTVYSGQTINDLKPTVRCDGGTMTTSVSQCFLTLLRFNYLSIHLTNDSSDCLFAYSEIFNNQRVESIQVKAQTGWCGNIATNDSTKVYYTNTLHINQLSSVLITKNPIAYNFTCAYNLTMQTSLNYSLNPVVSTAVLTPVTGGGSYSVVMAAYWNPEFTVPIQNGESVLVGTDIFLGLFIPDADGTKFVLRIVECIATPTNNYNDVNQILLISGGCAADSGVDTVVTNGVSLEARIQLTTFKFTNFDSVFIFCNVRLCDITEACTGLYLGLCWPAHCLHLCRLNSCEERHGLQSIVMDTDVPNLEAC
ncbi:uromodulin-like [Pelodytes ibericus]